MQTILFIEVIGDGNAFQALYTLLQYCMHEAPCFVLNQDLTKQSDLSHNLWHHQPESFFAHTIEDQWPQHPNRLALGTMMPKKDHPEGYLINLTDQIIDTLPKVASLVEVIPQDQALRQQARARYQHYKQGPFNVKMLKLEQQGDFSG